MHKPTFITGLAVGYVLGTRAGRERYDQISEAAHTIARAPAVQSATHTATRAAGQPGSRISGPYRRPQPGREDRPPPAPHNSRASVPTARPHSGLPCGQP